MHPTTSTFLHLLRVVAALVVFLAHIAQFFHPRAYAILDPLSHVAVIGFFVLSGFVIAHATLSRSLTASDFALARLSRLYSVVAPALVLTAVLQVIGQSFRPEFYAELSRGHEGLRFLLSGLFLQNIWTFSASPPTNGAFWSLSYEFWYYGLFGIAVFARRTAWKVGSFLVVAGLVGPNILLLLPCWLAGVAAWYLCRRKLPGRAWLRGLTAAIFLVGIAEILWLPQFPYLAGTSSLLFSGAFLSDWLLALTLGAFIVVLDGAGLPRLPEALAAGVASVADHTFSLYLYHFPLIVLAAAFFPRPSAGALLGIALLVLGVVFLLSVYTESRRGAWRRAFVWARQRMAGGQPG